MIRQKAQQIQTGANEKINKRDHSHLIFSDGWLGKCKRKWKLRVYWSYGESGDVDHELLAQGIPNIKHILSE